MSTEKQIEKFIQSERKQVSALADYDILGFVLQSDKGGNIFWPFIHAWANAGAVAACVITICFGVWFAKYNYAPREQFLVVNNVHLENVEYIVGGE